MSRLTGSEAKNLMEAYNAVYAPHEEVSVDLTEEDLEGIELIEMTVEEFDEFLSEQGGRNSPGARRAEAAKAQRVAQQQQVKTALGQGKGLKLQGATPGSGSAGTGYGTQLGGRQGVIVRGAATGSTGSGRSQRSNFQSAPGTVNVGGQTLYKAKSGKDIVYLQGKGKPQLFKPGQTTPAAAPPRQQPPAAAPRQQPPAAAPRQQPPAAAPATTSAKTTPAATPASTPAATPAAPATPARTFNPLMQRTFGYQTGNAPSQIAAASAGKPVPSGTALGSAANPQVRAALNLPAKPSLAAPAPRPVPVAAPAAKPVAAAPAPQTRVKSARERMLNQDLDLFDIVKGHLMSEGYADTEQAAAVIMANMSEEWRESIVEQMTGGSTDSPSDENKSFTGEGPKKPKGWKPTGPKLKTGQRPGYAR